MYGPPIKSTNYVVPAQTLFFKKPVLDLFLEIGRLHFLVFNQRGWSFLTIRDHILFGNAQDLERRLEVFQEYDNGFQIHQSLNQQTPEEAGGKNLPVQAALNCCAAITWSGVVSATNSRMIRNSPCTGIRKPELFASRLRRLLKENRFD